MFRPFVLSAFAAVLFTAGTAHACIPPLVEFAFGSARVSPEGQREVSLVSQMARADPSATVKLTATTDGSKSNRQMAHRRISAVKAMLARAGVPGNRIEVEYVGAGSDSSARLVMMELVSSPTCGS